MDNQDDRTVDFLLLEYETLMNLRQNYINLGDSRFNFYLSILSGAAVFLTWINSNNAVNSNSYSSIFVSVSVLIGVLALGWTTFNRIIRRNRSINHYSRGMARIRYYFVEKDPNLEDYLVLSLKADEPKFKKISYDEQLPIMLALLNGLVAGCGLGILVLPIAIWVSITLAIVVCALLVWGQLKHYANQMSRREGTLLADIPLIFKSQQSGKVIPNKLEQCNEQQDNNKSKVG